MTLPLTRHWLIWVAMASFLAALLMLILPGRGSALPTYSTATGQPCTTCHVNASGTGGLTATGQAFAAIPNHAADPAGAFAQVQAAAAPAATPAPTAAPAAPAPTTAPAAPAAAPAATPAALPVSGEASASVELPMILGLFGFFALAAGLSLGFRGARGR